MTIEMTAELLARDINEILGTLDRKALEGEAINWGDLSCVGIAERLWPTEDAFIAFIEEASPEASGLHKAILDALKTKGWRNYEIKIVTEW